MSALRLAYVALAGTDVEAAASILERDLGLRRSHCALPGNRRVPLFPIGDSALALFAPDDPFLGGPTLPGLHHLALATDDPEAVARESGLPIANSTFPAGLEGRRQTLFDPAATAGVRLRLCESLALDAPAAGLIERIDHLGVASADNEQAVAIFANQLGCLIESRQTDMEVQLAIESFTSDKYGVVYHTRPPVPVGGLRVAFLTVGDCDLEFLQPFNPTPDDGAAQGDRPGSTQQDRGAIGRFIAARGPGLHHLALKTSDINASLAALDAAGHRLIDKSGRPGSRRAQIGFLHPRALGGPLLHFVQRQPL